MTKNRHLGSRFDKFLEDEGFLANAETVAAKRVLAFIIQKEMKRQRLSKSKMALKMRTSRAALDRLLDPDNTAVTLHTMERSASALGKKLKIDLV
jgi:hypothetical protein